MQFHNFRPLNLLILNTVKTRELIPTLEDIFVTTRIVVIERYNFICRKKEKIESLEEFHADLVELASRADCGDREDEWVRDVFTAHILNENIAKKILAQRRRPQDAYGYAIRREKGTEHSRTMKTNPFGNQVSTPKQEPVDYINQRGRDNFVRKQSDTSKRPWKLTGTRISSRYTKWKRPISSTKKSISQRINAMLQIW